MDCHVPRRVQTGMSWSQVSERMEALFMEKTTSLPVLPKDPQPTCLRNGSGQIHYYSFTEVLQENAIISCTDGATDSIFWLHT